MSKLKFIFTILFLFTCFGIVSAQETVNENAPDEQQQNQRRPNLLRELGLTPDQTTRIREINQANRAEIRAAQKRVVEARRNLDQAIYADKADDASVEIRIREFQNAQAEIAKLRADTEFQIRKILTPEQLQRFRELRQNFEQFRNSRRQNASPLRMRNQLRNRRLNNRQNMPNQ